MSGALGDRLPDRQHGRDLLQRHPLVRRAAPCGLQDPAQRLQDETVRGGRPARPRAQRGDVLRLRHEAYLFDPLAPVTLPGLREGLARRATLDADRTPELVRMAVADVADPDVMLGRDGDRGEPLVDLPTHRDESEGSRGLIHAARAREQAVDNHHRHTFRMSRPSALPMSRLAPYCGSRPRCAAEANPSARSARRAARRALPIEVICP